MNVYKRIIAGCLLGVMVFSVNLAGIKIQNQSSYFVGVEICANGQPIIGTTKNLPNT